MLAPRVNPACTPLTGKPDPTLKSQQKHIPVPPPLKNNKGIELPSAISKVKSPLSCYLLFSNATRKEMMDAYPGMPVNHYSKLIGEKWRSLTEDERKPWYDAAKMS